VTVLADALRLRNLGEREVCVTGSEKRLDSTSSPIPASAWTARPASPLLNPTPCSCAPLKSAIVTTCCSRDPWIRSALWGYHPHRRTLPDPGSAVRVLSCPRSRDTMRCG
jgi:hypothetical protein